MPHPPGLLSAPSGEPDDRCARLKKRYEMGWTLKEIGQEERVTRERVRQLLKACGIPVSPRRDRLYRYLVREHAAEAEALFLTLRSDSKVAERLGFPESVVRRFIDDTIPDPGVLRRTPRTKGGASQYADQDIRDALTEAAAELGQPMTAADYQEWARDRQLDDGRRYPGAQTAQQRFGNWRSACQSAGLATHLPSAVEPKYTDAEAMAAICAAWVDLGKPPTVASYDEWRKTHKEHPSAGTILKFAGWDEFLLRCWPIVHDRPLPGYGSPDVPDEAFESDDFGIPYISAKGEQASRLERDPWETDPQLVERALVAHAHLQNMIAELARAAGWAPRSPAGLEPQYDVAWRIGDVIFLVEVKSATAANLESQLRLGLGQLLRYRATLTATGHVVRAALACELRPRDNVWLDLFASLDIGFADRSTLPDLVAWATP